MLFRSQVRREIEIRDERDTARAFAPLVQANDAVYLDSGSLTAKEVTAQIIALVKKVKP